MNRMTSVFLAAKTEECAVNIKDLMNIFPTFTESSICTIEIGLLIALNYQILIHHPHNLIPTVIADYTRWVNETIAHSTQTHTHTSHAVSDTAVELSVSTIEHKVTDEPISKRVKLEHSHHTITKTTDMDISISGTSNHHTASSHPTIGGNVHHTTIGGNVHHTKVIASLLAALPQGEASNMFKQWKDKCDQVIHILYCSNCMLLYTPIEIAISALCLCLSYTVSEEIDAYLAIDPGYLESTNEGFPTSNLTQLSEQLLLSFYEYIHTRYGSEFCSNIIISIIPILRSKFTMVIKGFRDQASFVYVKEQLKANNKW